MADTPQTAALITLAQEYRGDLVRQINRQTLLLKVLRIVRGGGSNIAWVAESSGALVENYSDGATASNFGSDAQTAAVLSWGLYRANFHVTKLAMDTSATASTPLGNRTLWARNQVNAMAALATEIESELFNGLGTGTLICGLDLAVGDTTNTYATIARGSASYWQPYVVDPGVLTTPTLGLLRKDLGAIYDQCGETPDIAVAPTSVFNAIAGQFDANRRWTQLNTARGSIVLDAGYEGIQVDNCMFLKSKDATANQIYYLNSNYVEIVTLPDSGPALELQDSVPGPNDGFGSVPLDMKFHPLAEVGPAKRAEVLANCQLKVSKPNSCGVRKNAQGV